MRVSQTKVYYPNVVVIRTTSWRNKNEYIYTYIYVYMLDIWNPSNYYKLTVVMFEFETWWTLPMASVQE